MCLSPRTTGNTSILPAYATVHMSLCICKVIKVAVQLKKMFLSSKWKLIRNILNWFGLYSNSKPEFLLLVVKLDKCFMVKPFKSTYNTQGYPQIGPNIRFRIINDSLNETFLRRKIDHVKKVSSKCCSNYPFFQKEWLFTGYLWFCTELLW